MKRFNDEFDLNIYNQFKAIAQEKNYNITHFINKKIPPNLKDVIEPEIKISIYSVPKGEKGTRSIAVEEENYDLIKNIVDKFGLTFKEVLTFVMLEVIKSQKKEKKNGLEFLSTDKYFRVPDNIYDVEDNVYKVVTINQGFPSHLIADIEGDHLLETFVKNEKNPEKILNGVWCCLESVESDREKYWVPEIFLKTVENEPEVMQKEFEWVLDQINFLNDDNYDYLYFLVALNTNEEYRLDGFKDGIILEKVIHSDLPEEKITKKIASKFLLYDMENLSTKELYVIFSQNNLKEVEKEYVESFGNKTKSNIFEEFKEIAENENQAPKTFLEKAILDILPNLTEKDLIKGKYFSEYSTTIETPLPSLPSKLDMKISNEVKSLIEKRMEGFEEKEITVDYLLEYIMYKKLLQYYDLDQKDDLIKAGDVLRLEEFPRPEVEEGIYYVKTVSQGHPVNLIPETINNLLRKWVNHIENDFIVEHILRDKWYYIEFNLIGKGHKFKKSYWIPKYVLDMKFGFIRRELNDGEELIGIESNKDSKILTK
ncbi:MAG: hypothetical protein ACOCV1_05510 [Bacillota bacterium]